MFSGLGRFNLHRVGVEGEGGGTVTFLTGDGRNTEEGEILHVECLIICIFQRILLM
jgi:hypothetical protein